MVTKSFRSSRMLSRKSFLLLKGILWYKIIQWLKENSFNILNHQCNFGPQCTRVSQFCVLRNEIIPRWVFSNAAICGSSKSQHGLFIKVREAKNLHSAYEARTLPLNLISWLWSLMLLRKDISSTSRSTDSRASHAERQKWCEINV